MASRVNVQLLDSAQGHPLQTWTFDHCENLTIGRSDENDVVVSDPYVSRSHAYLRFDEAGWRLISISQQRVVHQGQRVAELPLTDGLVFQLGPRGCFLRFEQAQERSNDRKTMMIDETLMPVFGLDQEKMAQEVQQITGGKYFQKLQDVARQRREERSLKEATP